MTDTLKILGQSNPLATTDTTIYTVPVATEAVVSTLFVANRSATPLNFRVAVVPSGGTLSDEHYIYYDIECPGNDTFTSTSGISMATGDFIVVRTDNATASFTVTGVQVTA